MKLIECVPNFSEGRDLDVIAQITASIEEVAGVQLLDVDPGADTNRTVVTFAGPLDAVEEAAFRAIRTAAELIDMRTHHGEHPRMGATDVCPFVPLDGATMDDCIEVAGRVAARVGAEAGIPVYLYEHAASGGRRSLAEVRHGEYEGLQDRPDRPDFGPDYNARTGATAVGARQFLIAYNVNLNTADRRMAHRVAQAVRELGTPRRNDDGTIIKDDSGKTLFEPGRFKEVKGVGWYIDEYSRSQVSLNLTDFTVASIHEVFDACREEAANLGMRVTGSELIGLVPREALLASGDHYLRKQGSTLGVSEARRIEIAVQSLGLEEVGPFDPAAKVVEYALAPSGGRLTSGSIAALAEEVSSDTPTPGGGSVSALAGALAAALASMVASLTFSKKGMEDQRSRMEQLGVTAHRLIDRLLEAVDLDMAAFDAVLAARRLPRTTPEQIAQRDGAIRQAETEATEVPLGVLETSAEVLALLVEVAEHGNPTSVTDAGVGGWCGLAAAEGASLNVRINLSGLAGDHHDLMERHDIALARARELAAAVAQRVEEKL